MHGDCSCHMVEEADHPFMDWRCCTTYVEAYVVPGTHCLQWRRVCTMSCGQCGRERALYHTRAKLHLSASLTAVASTSEEPAVAIAHWFFRDLTASALRMSSGGELPGDVNRCI